MSEEWPWLRRGAVLEMCVALFRLHRLDASGWCRVCQVPADCAPRRNCAKVMRAAALDPARFDVRDEFDLPPRWWQRS